MRLLHFLIHNKLNSHGKGCPLLKLNLVPIEVQTPVLEKHWTKTKTKTRLNGCSPSPLPGLGLLHLTTAVFIGHMCVSVFTLEYPPSLGGGNSMMG